MEAEVADEAFEAQVASVAADASLLAGVTRSLHTQLLSMIWMFCGELLDPELHSVVVFLDRVRHHMRNLLSRVFRRLSSSLNEGFH